jgi:hypothetical protein
MVGDISLVFEEGKVIVTLEDEERKNVTLGIVEEIITFFQCSKTVLLAQKKNDTHVSFDDKSAFWSLNSNVQ